MAREYRLQMRLVLLTVTFLILGVYSVFLVVQDSQVMSSLDGLLPGGGASKRVHRSTDTLKEKENINASDNTPKTTKAAVDSTSAHTTNDSVTTASSSNTQAETTANSTVTSEATSLPPTTTAPVPCTERPFAISQVCNLTLQQKQGYLGAGVVLEELADTFFNSIVLDALATRCEGGSWCLEYDFDKDLLLGDSGVYMQYCDLEDCLKNIPKDCMTPERQLVISTLNLLCDARMLNVSDRCMLGIKKMTHIALIDEVVTVNETGPNCTIDKDGGCTDECLKLGQQLRCMWSACYDEMDAYTLATYGQWQWALDEKMDNSTDICNHNNTQCSAFSDSPVLKLKVLQQMLYRIQQTGPAVLAGIITALVVTIAGFGIIFWACAKKVYVYYEYSRDRVEYTEVKDSAQIPDELDSDEEVDELHPA